MSEHAEKVLKHAGKLMQCIEELGEEDEMGERYMGERYGNREGGSGGRGGGSYGNRYGGRMGERDDWEDDDEEDYGERRRRSSRTGRFI